MGNQLLSSASINKKVTDIPMPNAV